PTHRLSPLFGGGPVPIRLRACDLRKHFTVAVTEDELHRKVEVQQTRERFTRHRAGKHIAAHDDTIDVRLTNIPEHRLERRKVSVDVVERGDSHRPFLDARLEPDTTDARHVARSWRRRRRSFSAPPQRTPRLSHPR